jgi:hypothetical protein
MLRSLITKWGSKFQTVAVFDWLYQTILFSLLEGLFLSQVPMSPAWSCWTDGSQDAWQCSPMVTSLHSAWPAWIGPWLIAGDGSVLNIKWEVAISSQILSILWRACLLGARRVSVTKGSKESPPYEAAKSSIPQLRQQAVQIHTE